MSTWNPADNHAAHRRPGIDRPAVAVILTVALVLGALVGLYAAHVTAPSRDGVTSSARVIPGIQPVRRTYTRGHEGRRPLPRIYWHTTSITRGTV